jgi:Icc protein
VSHAPVRLIQFTDLHLGGAGDGTLRGVATQPALEATLAAAQARHAPWAALLLTGDLVQDDPAGYARVRALFGGSAVPVYCLPGNHDCPQAMRRALAQRPFQICGSAVHGEWLVVMLDSCLAGSAGGQLAPAELERLDATLAAHRDRHALVALHHHPLPLGSRWLDAVALGNPADLFAVLDRHRHVRALVWGHVHQAAAAQRAGVQLLATPSTCVQFKPGVEGFAVDPRPPAYRWLDLHPDGRIDTGVEWVASAALAARAAAGAHLAAG